MVNRLRTAIQNTVILPGVRAVCRPRVHGAGILDQVEGPMVLVANHVSLLDYPVLLAALPAGVRSRTAAAAAADYFYRGRLRGAALSLALNTVAFERHGCPRAGLRSCGRILTAGGVLVVFPEGTRSRDGRLGEFRRGAALLAISAGAAIVPVGVQGLDVVLPVGAHLPRPHPVEVRFGEPLHRLPGEDSRALTARLRAAVQELSGQDAEPMWAPRPDGLRARAA